MIYDSQETHHEPRAMDCSSVACDAFPLSRIRQTGDADRGHDQAIAVAGAVSQIYWGCGGARCGRPSSARYFADTHGIDASLRSRTSGHYDWCDGGNAQDRYDSNGAAPSGHRPSVGIRFLRSVEAGADCRVTLTISAWQSNISWLGSFCNRS